MASLGNPTSLSALSADQRASLATLEAQVWQPVAIPT
jgi:hypothetical protein